MSLQYDKYNDIQKYVRAQGNPKAFTPEMLATSVAEYLLYCSDNNKIPTIAGMCCYCHISYNTLKSYYCIDDYVPIVDYLRMQIAQWCEQELLSDKRRNIDGIKVYLRHYYKWEADNNITVNTQVNPVVAAIDKMLAATADTADVQQKTT